MEQQINHNNNNNTNKKSSNKQSIINRLNAIWDRPIIGITVLLTMNAAFGFIWCNEMNMISIIIALMVIYVISRMISLHCCSCCCFGGNDNKGIDSQQAEQGIDGFIKSFNEYLNINWLYGSIDVSDAIEVIVVAYIITLLSVIIPYPVMVWMVMNALILNKPINGVYPHFFVDSYITTKQIIKGVIGVISCLIPMYDEDMDVTTSTSTGNGNGSGAGNGTK